MIAIRLVMILYSLLVAACGGGDGGSPAAAPAASAPPKQYALRMMVQSGHDAVPGFNASANFPSGLEPGASVEWQAGAPGYVTLIMEPFRDTRFERLDEYLVAAKAHPNIGTVYVYDELFWASDGKALIEIGSHEAEITAAARRVQLAGFKSAVSIDSEVILDPAFKLADPGAFDVVMIVIYPDAWISQDSHGCALEANRYTNLLACSVARLRAIGFAGQIAYVYQAFGIAPDGTALTDRLAASMVADLQLQRAAIEAGPSLGVDWLIAFGFYPWEKLTAPLFPGKGTVIEALVLP